MISPDKKPQPFPDGRGAGQKVRWVETPGCGDGDCGANRANAPVNFGTGLEIFSGPGIGHSEINERLVHALDWCHWRKWQRDAI